MAETVDKMSECKENTTIPPNTSKTALLDAVVDFTGGTLGGMANVFVSQPLDTIKVKVQTYPHLYRSSFHCFVSTYKTDGFSRGLYRGTVPSLTASVADNSVLFCAYGICQSAIGAAIGKDASKLSTIEKASAGFCAAFFSSLVLCPTELIKCQLQTLGEATVEGQATAPKTISPFQLTRKIVRTHGVQGLFRGLIPTVAREMPGSFMFFGGYELTKSLLTSPDRPEGELGILRTIIAGGTGGCCYWLSIFPADVIKSRLQVLPIDSTDSFMSTFRHIIKNEGIIYSIALSDGAGRNVDISAVSAIGMCLSGGVGALYSGILPTLLRTFPATAALFLTYEYTKNLLGSLYKS